MKVLGASASLPVFKNKTCITIGVFDGVHLGHKKLISAAVSCAKKNHGKSLVLTFETHPDIHLGKVTAVKLIKSMEHKIKLIASLGVDYTLVLDFKKIASMTPEEFVRDFLIKKLNMGSVIAGEDFIFGKRGAGNVATLKTLSRKYGFNAVIIKDLKAGKKKISSTNIRRALKSGDIKTVKKMLGRPYTIEAEVLHGRRAGFDLPTANMKIAYERIPANGVWAVRVNYGGKKYLGAANIGTAPTIKNEVTPILEVFIFNFHKNIYGKKLKVTFLGKIRDEKRFKSKEALLKRVRLDINTIKRKFKY